MGLSRTLVCAAMLAMTAPAAYALTLPQDGVPATGDGKDIVVTGKRAGPDKTITTVRAISAAYDGQLARFETPICPAAVGLPRSHAIVVEARIREAAAWVEMPVAKPGCDPNLTMIVAGDGAAFVNRLRRKRPTLFDSLSVHDLMRLEASSGPSWTWQAIAPKRRDGGPIAGSPLPGIRARYMISNAQLSRLSVAARQDIELAFVVIERDKLDGLTLKQIADYTAMVGLAAIRTTAPIALGRPSILTLFDDMAGERIAQPEATAFDRAYLAGLYAGQSGYSSDQKSTSIAQRIDRTATP